MKTFVDDEFEADMQPPFQICFGEGEPFGAAAIVESLVWLCNEVERACTSIAEAHSADLQSGAA